MKKWSGILVLAFMAVGCKHEVVVSDENGNKVAVDTSAPGNFTVTDDKGKTTTAKFNADNKEMTIKDSEGNSLSMSANAVSEADLGVPFYPGSEAVEGSMKSSNPKENFVMCNRTTSDDPAKVIAFYKSKMKDGKDTTMSSDGGTFATVTGKRADGAEMNVVASKSKDQPKTTISITVGKKN